MAEPTWPPGSAGSPFPQLGYMGTEQSFDNGTTYYKTSNGPGKLRVKGTRQPEYHRTPIELSGAQLKQFNTWFEDSTGVARGSKPFTWTNLITGEVNARYRFKQGKRPKFLLVSPSPNAQEDPDQPTGGSQRYYTGVVELELLPS